MPSMILEVTSWQRNILQGRPRNITLSTAVAQSVTDTRPDKGENLTCYLISIKISAHCFLIQSNQYCTDDEDCEMHLKNVIIK